MPSEVKHLTQSSLGIKPPTNRNTPGRDYVTWLEDKRETDGAEGLWRVHDGLYDLTDFVSKHPGGPSWLLLSQGIDITEAFEAHHVTTSPEKILEKYFVRKASTSRNSPFTFHDNGFYKTLKREVQLALKEMPKYPSRTTDFFIDLLLVLLFSLSCVGVRYWNFFIGILAGNALAMITIAAHNYFHRKDNFRMYYFNLSLMKVREWRVSHVLSHHLHTNTIDDMEISDWEPILNYLPVKKNPLKKYGQWLVAPLVWLSNFHLSFIQRVIIWLRKERKGYFDKYDLVPLTLPIFMYVIGGQSLLWTIVFWSFVVIVGSTHFFFVGLHAAHHHPDIFHDGDTPRSTQDYDWGLSQLDAVMDRKEITGSHFLVLTNFGDHALHHLFPTLDHGQLEYLYPVLHKVLKQYDVNLRMVSQLDTILGGFQQLIREEPNPFPPDLNKYSKTY